MSRNYISPAMLPLETISEYMDKVAGFGKKEDSSKDTLHVAGIKSELIASAAVYKGELVEDRNTVWNSLQLGGVDASEYVTTSGADALLADTYQVSINSGNEVKNLRDELYQLKAELAKAGLVKNTDCYNGFIEAFKEGNEKFINQVITKTIVDSSSPQIGSLIVEDNREFKVGEYLVIGTDTPQIVKILDMVGTDRIDLESSASGPIAAGTDIYKSYGAYNNGMFVFGKKKDLSISSQERYIILNDDAQPLVLTKNYLPNSGYAAQINIPSTAKGAIRKVGVQAKVTGNPGGLRCYVIDNTNSTEDVFTMSTIEEMKLNNKIVGESNLVYASQATQAYNELFFEFPTNVILDKANYIFLIVQINADTNNYWELKGLRGEQSLDLQTNSKLYNFAEGTTMIPTEGDLYLIVVTSEVLIDNMQYSRQGLYSTAIELQEMTKATRVRVELKANREGRFAVVENPHTLLPSKNSPLVLFNEDNKAYSASLFSVGQKIAIGNQIGKVGNSVVDNTSFNLEDLTYAPAGSSVYRIGYKVQAKACVRSIDESKPLTPITKNNFVLVELPLVAILPGKESGKESISSDRLIFEGEIKTDDSGYILEQFNDIEVQVYWENKGATNTDLNNFPELAGKILDITISTDNTYNIKK